MLNFDQIQNRFKNCMDHESGRRRPEVREVKPQTLPPEIAKKFVDGSVLDDAPIVRRTKKSRRYRLFESKDTVAGFENVFLTLDYRQQKDPNSEDPDAILFEYTPTDAVGIKEGEPLAEMYFGIEDTQHFILRHRYVRPENRTRSGIGTRLLYVAEGWMQQVADASGQPVTVTLETGQDSVIRWIQKMGYTVAEHQRPLLEELEQHPERFVQDEVFVSEESRIFSP